MHIPIRDILDITFPSDQLRNFLLIEVNAKDNITGFGKGDSQGKAGIAKTNDAYF